jgi:hypothetical protein
MSETQDIEELFRRLGALSQRVEILEHALNVKVGGEEKKSTPPPFFEFYKERGDLK